MVMTHKGQADKANKRKEMFVKEDNLGRLSMPHDEAVADSKRQRDEWEKVQAYKMKLAQERAAPPRPEVVTPEEQVVVATQQDANSPEIAKLKAKYESERGPGSKHRKDKLKAKIEELGGSI